MGEVSIDFRDQLALITIDNPPVNALSQAVRSGLIDAIEEIELKNKSEIIILICGGRTFCAGADIREFSKPVLSPHLSEVITRI